MDRTTWWSERPLSFLQRIGILKSSTSSQRGQYERLSGIRDEHEGDEGVSYGLGEEHDDPQGQNTASLEQLMLLEIHHANSCRGRQAQIERLLTPPGLLAGSASHSSTAIDGGAPTETEKATLRKVSDRLPWSAFLIALTELCERFTYYGLSGPFQNYIANSYNDPNGLPGAIGLGQTGATALLNFFTFLCYLTPIFGAAIADQYWGKYWTIYYFSIVYMLGCFVLFLTSLPIAIENGFALGGIIVAMVIIGLGTGGIKSNVAPLIAEQYSNTKPFVRTLKSGERVIVDPAITIQRIYMVFYTCINLGSLSALVTTELELYIGFWSAYLLCGLVFIVSLAILKLGRQSYVVRPPKGSVIPHALRICWIGLRYRSLDAARPEYYQGITNDQSRVPWDSVFVDEVRRALSACKVFLFLPVYWVVNNQIFNNLVSQAGQMQLHGIPNDVMQNIDSITVIIFIPLMDQLVYPFLRQLGFPFKAITRIAVGFMLGGAGILYAAGVQSAIYRSGPCYTAPRACEAALQPDGTYAPNNVHVALQTPAYWLIGLSEIFAVVTGLEYAYTKAPASMKSLIMSFFLLTNSFGAIAGAAISPFMVNPKLSWVYMSLGIVCLVTGFIFWLTFHKLNESEEELDHRE